MRKMISGLLVAVLLTALAACGGTPPSSGQEPESTSSASANVSPPNEPPQEDKSVVPAEYTSLVQLCNTIAKPGLYWHCELPGVEYGREHIAVTKELQTEIYKILTEHEPLLRPDLQDDDSRDRIGDALIFDIWGSDDGLYPNSDQLVFAAIIPLGSNDPVAPNSTFVAIGIGEDCYTYPAEVYDNLLPLLQANSAETHVDFEGSYTRMALSQAETYPVWGETLECGDVLLHSAYASYGLDDVPPKTKWLLEAFDLNTGTTLYSIEYPNFAGRGAMTRVSALNDVPDYDYVLFFEAGYAYRNSKDSSKEVYFDLPGEVKPLRDTSGRTTPYDEHDDYMIWVESDGTHLRTAKQDGVSQKLILPDTDLPALFPDPDGYNGTLSYIAPRFICGGTKAVATVYSDSQMQDIGVVVFDIASGKMSSIFPYSPPTSSEYPVTDRYIANLGMGGPMKIFDAQTGEATDIPSLWVGRSYDYKTFIAHNYNNSLDARNAPSYICDISNVKDRSNPLLIPGNPYALINLPDVTENYAIFNVSDFDGDWIAAAKYR